MVKKLETKIRHINTHSIILCAIFSALIGIGAFIKIPIPILPFTLQFLFTTLAGLLLGSKLGAVSVLVYIFVGLVGFPVFTTGGGIGYIFQPTFGYIIGFCVGAYVTGLIVEKSKSLSIKTLLFSTFSGLVIVYTFGMVYYYLICKYYVGSPIGIKALFIYCFLLAIPGDIFICVISAFLGKRLIPIVRKDMR